MGRMERPYFQEVYSFHRFSSIPVGCRPLKWSRVKSIPAYNIVLKAFSSPRLICCCGWHLHAFIVTIACCCWYSQHPRSVSANGSFTPSSATSRSALKSIQTPIPGLHHRSSLLPPSPPLECVSTGNSFLIKLPFRMDGNSSATRWRKNGANKSIAVLSYTFYLNHILVAIQLRGELVVNKRSGDKEEDVLVVSNWVGKIWFIARGVHLIYECAEQWRIKSRRRRPWNGKERRDNISLPLLDRRMMAQLLD